MSRPRQRRAWALLVAAGGRVRIKAISVGRVPGAVPGRGGGEGTQGWLVGAGRCRGHQHSILAVGTTSQGWTGDLTSKVMSCQVRMGE